MLNTYYLIENGQQTGPFSHHELMDRGLHAEELVLSPITNQWESAAAMFEFADYFESQGIYYPTPAILANFWWRVLAYIIDYMIYYILIFLFGVVLGLISVYTGNHWFDSGFDYDTNLGLKLISVLVFFFYHATFESSRLQGSIGKVVCRLKVVNAAGERISFGTALARNFAKILSSLLCGLGFLMVLWNDKKQAWHDQLAKTFIIRKP
ncbi:MAG: RDD family protein [Mucilaginibacter sp.]|nr:RDD family protein [Mucilaginibacter sp.]